MAIDWKEKRGCLIVLGAVVLMSICGAGGYGLMVWSQGRKAAERQAQIEKQRAARRAKEDAEIAAGTRAPRREDPPATETAAAPPPAETPQPIQAPPPPVEASAPPPPPMPMEQAPPPMAAMPPPAAPALSGMAAMQPRVPRDPNTAEIGRVRLAGAPVPLIAQGVMYRPDEGPLFHIYRTIDSLDAGRPDLALESVGNARSMAWAAASHRIAERLPGPPGGWEVSGATSSVTGDEWQLALDMRPLTPGPERLTVTFTWLPLEAPGSSPAAFTSLPQSYTLPVEANGLEMRFSRQPDQVTAAVAPNGRELLTVKLEGSADARLVMGYLYRLRPSGLETILPPGGLARNLGGRVDPADPGAADQRAAALLHEAAGKVGESRNFVASQSLLTAEELIEARLGAMSDSERADLANRPLPANW